MPDTLHLRSAVIGGQTAPDDYSVIDAGHVVGRIRRASERIEPNTLRGSLSALGHGERRVGLSSNARMALTEDRSGDLSRMLGRRVGRPRHPAAVALVLASAGGHADGVSWYTKPLKERG
jgi:hypothetical protein